MGSGTRPWRQNMKLIRLPWISGCVRYRSNATKVAAESEARECQHHRCRPFLTKSTAFHKSRLSLPGSHNPSLARGSTRMLSIQERIAAELNVGVNQVAAAVELLDDGATVPFIARYRKEVDRRARRRAAAHAGGAAPLPARARGAPRGDPEEHHGAGQADAALEAPIRDADSKARLEDIYLPYKPKRRTKAQIAREAGLEPLAELLLARPDARPGRPRRRRFVERRGRRRRRRGRARRRARTS